MSYSIEILETHKNGPHKARVSFEPEWFEFWRKKRKVVYVSKYGYVWYTTKGKRANVWVEGDIGETISANEVMGMFKRKEHD